MKKAIVVLLIVSAFNLFTLHNSFAAYYTTTTTESYSYDYTPAIIIGAVVVILVAIIVGAGRSGTSKPDANKASSADGIAPFTVIADDNSGEKIESNSDMIAIVRW